MTITPKTPTGMGELKINSYLLLDVLNMPEEVGKLVQAYINEDGDLCLRFISPEFANNDRIKVMPFTIEYTEESDGAGTIHQKGTIVKL